MKPQLSALFLIGVALAAGCNPLDPYGCKSRDALVVDDRALDDGTVGVAYDHEVDLDISAADIAVTSGALPDGLDLVQDGGRFFIRGTPTKAGAFDATLEAIEHGTQCSGRAGRFDVHIDVLAP